MRGPLALLLIGLLAPSVLAQTVLPSASVTIQAEHFEEHAKPSGEPVASAIVVELSCDASAAAGRIVVDYAITDIPPWATALIEPAHDEADASRCEDGIARFEARLLASASTDAPAFQPEAIGVRVEASQPLRPVAVGEGSLVFSAGYFSIVDASTDSTLLALDRGGSDAFHVRFTNHGNANTRIDFELLVDGEGLRAHPPAPITLASRQGGGPTTSQDVVLWVERTDASTRPATVLLRWQAAYALDRFIRGDSGTMSFTVAASGEGEDPPRPPGALIDDVEARVPTPSAPLVVALVALFALLRRR